MKKEINVPSAETVKAVTELVVTIVNTIADKCEQRKKDKMKELEEK